MSRMSEVGVILEDDPDLRTVRFLDAALAMINSKSSVMPSVPLSHRPILYSNNTLRWWDAIQVEIHDSILQCSMPNWWGVFFKVDQLCLLQSWHRGQGSHRKVVSLDNSPSPDFQLTGPSDLLGSRHVQSISSGLGQETLSDPAMTHYLISMLFPITQN